MMPPPLPVGAGGEKRALETAIPEPRGGGPDRLKPVLQNVPAVERNDLGSGEDKVQARGFWQKLASGLDWVFGFGALLVLLAGCSVVPVLNFLSLGYLLHVSGTIARTGRFRDGFIGVRKAAVLGSIAAGIWLVVWPARLLSQMWKDAELVAAGSGIAKGWHAGLVVVIVLTLVHVAWACVRGGRLRHFLWPQPLRFMRWLRAPEKFGNLQRVITEYVMSLRLPFYFWLGLRGFVGALLWLIVPVGILLGATRLPVGGAVLLSLFGGLLLLLVAIHLPFLQAHFAQTDRFGAMFELREVRRLFVRAPLAFWLALLITLLFAVPLYLLKIELTPRELAWLPSLLFVIFIFPARILTGWAMSRAARREEPRHWFPRWVARLGIVPVALVYTLVVYFTPYLSWNGAWSLLEQHAFLVPAPLMAL